MGSPCFLRRKEGRKNGTKGGREGGQEMYVIYFFNNLSSFLPVECENNSLRGREKKLEKL